MGERTLGELEHVVLLTVARLGEPYGAQVHEELVRVTGREISVPGVYVTLGRLLEKGCLEERTGEPTPERGGRARRHVRLSPEGARLLASTRDVLDRLWSGIDPAVFQGGEP